MTSRRNFVNRLGNIKNKIDYFTRLYGTLYKSCVIPAGFTGNAYKIVLWMFCFDICQ